MHSTNKIRFISYVIDILGQSLGALKDNRLRTILSVLGITIGIMSVMAVGTISKGGRYLVFSELETFGLKSIWVFRDRKEKDPHRAVRVGTGINNSDYDAIRNGCCTSIEAATPIVGAGRRLIIKNGNRYSNGGIFGVGEDYLTVNNDGLTSGRPFRTEDVRRRRNVVIIGPEVQTDLFGEQQNSVGKEIRVDGKKYTIVGVLEEKSRDFLSSIGSAANDANNRVLIPYTVLQSINGQKDTINWLQLETTGLEHTDSAVSQIKELLKRRHNNKYSYKVETMASYIDATSRILQGVSVIGVVAASISLLVGGMGIMNIMSTSVLERIREIGLRKAIGARKIDILFQFLMEAVFISTIGGLLGLVFGFLLSFVLASATGFPLEPSWAVVAIALFVSMVVGLMSGYYPARRAATLQPVVALRYE